MFAILVSLMMLATPLSPASNGNHKGWAKNGKLPPPPSRPPVEEVSPPPYSGSGNQGSPAPAPTGERTPNRYAD